MFNESTEIDTQLEHSVDFWVALAPLATHAERGFFTTIED